MTTLAHLKAVNAIFFCDNATLAAATHQSCKVLFTRKRKGTCGKGNAVILSRVYVP